jgi:tRNA-splicing ligase RtcB
MGKNKNKQKHKVETAAPAASAKLKVGAEWKSYVTENEAGYYDLRTEDTGDVIVRLFLTPALLEETEETLYSQIVNATRFPGVKLVAITPDTHYGYGVPVGSVILTDGTVAMGPVGFDIGCGMVAARSSVPASEATPKKRLEFNRAVIERVGMGLGHGSKTSMRDISEREFQELIRGGAEYYIQEYGEPFSRARAERNRIPVDDSWDVPKGSKAMRGMSQLGTLGSGNHFAELQECIETGTLSVQVHSGSRGFGHGLAEWYFSVAKKERPDEITHLDLGYFTPDSPNYRDYLNAVAAGGNYAIINRLMLFSEIARAFRRVFGSELELVYEISHNLVQAETHPEFGDVWVHRKGATRAFPAGHPALAGTMWADEGHPVLIPGSNRDFSYILRASAGAINSAYSVNHGAGRRMSRGSARRELSQKVVNAQYKAAGIIVNDNDDVPLDESDACYKSSKEVIQAVERAGLARVEYTFWPLASLKGLE